MITKEHPMIRRFKLWCTALAFSTTGHNIQPLLHTLISSQFDRNPNPRQHPQPPPPPQQSPEMPTRMHTDLDPGTMHAPDDHDVRDSHDVTLPDDPPEPDPDDTTPPRRDEYNPADFTDVAPPQKNAQYMTPTPTDTTTRTHDYDTTPAPVSTIPPTTYAPTTSPPTQPSVTPQHDPNEHITTTTTTDITDLTTELAPQPTPHDHDFQHHLPTIHPTHTDIIPRAQTEAHFTTTLSTPTRSHTATMHTPTTGQRKSPPELMIVTPHTHETRTSAPSTTEPPLPVGAIPPRPYHAQPNSSHSPPTAFAPHPPSTITTQPTIQQHDTYINNTQTNTNYTPTDATTLFTDIFNSNPAFAESFMDLVRHYKPSPMPLPHLPTAVRETLPLTQRYHTSPPIHHLPPTITRYHPTAFHPQTSIVPPQTTTLPPTTTAPVMTHPSPTTPFTPAESTQPPAHILSPANTTERDRPPNPATPDRQNHWTVVRYGNRNPPPPDTANTITFPPLNTPTRIPHIPQPASPNLPYAYDRNHPTQPCAPLPPEDNIEEEEIPLSQSDYLPPVTISSTQAHSTYITALTDQQDITSTDHTTLAERHAEGRVWTRDAIKRKCIVVKIAIVASESCDQSPTTSALEPVINAIVTSLGLPFTVDRVAILSFDTAIPTRQGSIYFSYAFLSPRTTNPHTVQHTSIHEIRRQLEILQGTLHSRLDGPNYFDTIPNLPPIASHLRVSIPLINDMDETFRYLIDGVSVALLLGNNGRENVLTLRYLGFLIFKAIRALYPTLPPYEPFPHALAKLKTRYDIGRIISVKKIRFSRTPPSNTNPPPPVRSLLTATNTTPPHPLLGIVITNSTPLCDIINDAIYHVCVTHASRLHLCGPPSSGISVHLHQKPPTIPEQLSLAKEISTRHSTLHNASQHKIVRGIRIHQHALIKETYLTTAAGSIANCVGFLPDFSNGVADLLLTGLFRASRETSFLRPDNVTSRIVEANATSVNLNPGPPPRPQPPPPSLRSPTTNRPQGRGRGSSRQSSQDRSGALYRVQANSSLRISATPSHKFYVVINGIGGISTTNIYALDFDNDGIRLLIQHVPFSMHKSFGTYPEAWTYFTSYYTHISTPDDATFMNENCPRESSNLTNPCQRFQEIQGLNFVTPSQTVRAFKHYDDLHDDIKLKRDAASHRMASIGCTPLDGFTFLAAHDPPTTVWISSLAPPPAPFPQDDTHHHNHPPASPMHDDTSMQATSTQVPTPLRHAQRANTDDTSMQDQSATQPAAHLTTTRHTPATAEHKDDSDDDEESNTQRSFDLLTDDRHEEIEGLSQDSDRLLHINAATKKRSRHDSQLSTTTRDSQGSLTYIIFNVELALTNTNIMDELEPAFEDAHIPDDAYDPTLRFHGFPSIYNTVEKHAILKCLDLTFVDRIISSIQTRFEASYAYRTDNPPTAPVPEDIDMLQVLRPRRYCQITSCTFHHKRRDVFPDTPGGLHAAEAHGVHLHHALYTTLSTEELASIGWLRCCDLCPTIYLNNELMDTHRQRCITYINSRNFGDTHAERSHQLRSGRFSSLYMVCPPSRVHELDDLIMANPNSDPITLFAVVHGWHSATTSPVDERPSATTTTQP